MFPDTLPSLPYSFIDQTMQPGPVVSLKCSASGNPTPIIEWTLDGYDLPQNDRFMIGQYVTVHGDVISHLNISQAKVEDGGLYGCEATNRLDEAINQLRIGRRRSLYIPIHKIRT
jgi:hypothetical protein